MRDIIKNVLNRYINSQGNMSSEAFRDTLVTEIVAVLESKGCYTEYDDADVTFTTGLETNSNQLELAIGEDVND